MRAASERHLPCQVAEMYRNLCNGVKQLVAAFGTGGNDRLGLSVTQPQYVHARGLPNLNLAAK